MKPVRPDHLHLFEHEGNETIIGENSRHPAGMWLIIFNGVFLLSVLLALLFFAVRNQDQVLAPSGGEPSFDATGLITIVFSILAVLLVLGTLAAVYVYHNNYIVLTDRKLVLIRQTNIISRKVSQLSIGDVQDTTVDQNSLLSRIFKFGTINIETAGEQANFSFTYAEDPHNTAKAIVQAHEKNLELYGN